MSLSAAKGYVRSVHVGPISQPYVILLPYVFA